MTAESATTVRVPTSRLCPAVEAALVAWRRERHAQVEAVLAAAMAPPVRTWWERLLRIDAGVPFTRDQAMAKLQTPRSQFGRSEYDRIRSDWDGDYARLDALRDACDLGLDAVDVGVADVALFKAHYRPDGEGYR